MKYKYNGEYWYRDCTPWLLRVAMWFIHIAGWLMPHWTTEGYTYRWNVPAIRRALRARGSRSRTFALYSSMCPMTLLGGRIVFQPFGVSYYSRRVKGWYCLHYRIKNPGPKWRKQWYAYRSHNSTPHGADTWYFGAPRDVLTAAQMQHDRMVTAREEREQKAASFRERERS